MSLTAAFSTLSPSSLADSLLAQMVDALSGRVAETQLFVSDAVAIRIAERGVLQTVPQSLTVDLPLYVFERGEWQYRGADWSEERIAAWLATEWQRCTASLRYFVAHYVCTINEYLEAGADAMPTVELVPIWPHVEAVLNALDPPHDVVIEKSRDMMLSWLVMASVLHDVMFRANWPVMTLSRLETLVDDGGEASTRDSLHGKVRFMYDHLPGAFQAVAPLTFKYLQIRNEKNGSHCTGFSATPSAGRGPKWKRAVLDEFAWVPHSQQVMHSVGPACPVGKVLVSTPHGKGNAFYDLREQARSVYPTVEDKPAHWQRLTIHWTLHPERDESWYKAKCAERTPEAIAQELDLNYTKSLGGRVYSPFSHELHVAGAALCPVKECKYDSLRGPLIVCCDWNYDPLVWELVQVWSELPKFRVIGEICRRSAVVEDVERELILRFGSQGVVAQLLDEHPDWADDYGRHGMMEAGPEGHRGQLLIYGDATEEKSTVHNRVKTYQGLKQSLKAAGFDVVLRVPPVNPPRQQRFEVHNHALGNGLIVVSPDCEELRKDYESGVWNSERTDMNQAIVDDDGSRLTRSHASSALGYFLCCVHKPYTSITAIGKGQSRSVRSYLPAFIRGW